MTVGKPLWLRGVEAVDKVAAPALEGATRHEAFGLGVTLLQRTKRAVYRRTERTSRRVLHGLNLPTASDVNRLLTQITAVENRIRTLSMRMEQHTSDAALPGALSRDEESPRDGDRLT